MLMSPHNRAVDKHFFKIGITGELREETMPDALPRPTGKALIGVIPETKLRSKVTPRTARTGNPEYRLDKRSIVRGVTTRIAALTGQQRFDPLKLVIP